MAYRWLVLLLGLASAPLMAKELQILIEIPRLNVAEYHRPYVAVWIEKEEGGVASNLAVWYDIKMRENKGLEWLKDMRLWWRRTGRELELPIDGVSGATRAPGLHVLTFSQGKSPLGNLPDGEYKLIVEAAREVGGREVVQIPFQWPPAKAMTHDGKGESELGKVGLKLSL